MRFRRVNPIYRSMGNGESFDIGYSDASATYTGVVSKTALLLLIVAGSALYFANVTIPETIGPSFIGALIFAPIIAIIMVIMTHRMPQIAFATSIVYAICEGVFLGMISLLYSYYYGGEIVQTALLATFGVLGGMLLLYSTGIIRVGNFMRRALYSALIGLIFASLGMFLLNITGVMSFEGMYNFYVLIVLVSVVVSSLYLLVDFDNITTYVNANAPKEYEWSLALGLVVTIVWLYIELLRLLAIIASRFRD